MVVYAAAAALAALVGYGARTYFSEHVTLPPLVGDPSVPIGGPFDLVDHTGKPVTDRDYRGHLLLVFFGFTYCPDVCPTTLGAISEAMDILGKDADRVIPLFITIDPSRDTPDGMAEYVRHFHPAVIGLTGTPEQVAAVAKAYRVFYAYVPKPGAAEDEYDVDHSTTLYLMWPDGAYRTHMAHTTPAATIARRVLEHL
ncbi:MAG: SCO family protein [Rhodospirillales bacterium]|nr:SCO family protein [Rhodospirillales bacterium]